MANWGANGYLVDLADMLDDTDKSEIIPRGPCPLYQRRGQDVRVPHVHDRPLHGHQSGRL